MTSRRATKRLRRAGVARATQSLAAPPSLDVTERERAVLEDMRRESSFPDGQSQLFTLPGCDRPEHRQHIQSLMLAVAMGHPSCGTGFYRMRCGCALLIHGKLSMERL